jgi:hypothetical protein
MVNRLEQEFPRSSWRAAPPSGARGLNADLVQRSLDRGRRLRNRAIRTSFRRGIAVVAQTIHAAIAPGHRALRPAGRPRSERDCWASPAHGA